MTPAGGDETVGEVSRHVGRLETRVDQEMRDLRQTCAQQASAAVQQQVYAVHRENDKQDVTDLVATVAALRTNVESLERANADRVVAENARYRRVFATAITGVVLPVLVAFLVIALRGVA